MIIYLISEIQLQQQTETLMNVSTCLTHRKANTVLNTSILVTPKCKITATNVIHVLANLCILSKFSYFT